MCIWFKTFHRLNALQREQTRRLKRGSAAKLLMQLLTISTASSSVPNASRPRLEVTVQSARQVCLKCFQEVGLFMATTDIRSCMSETPARAPPQETQRERDTILLLILFVIVSLRQWVRLCSNPPTKIWIKKVQLMTQNQELEKFVGLPDIKFI